MPFKRPSPIRASSTSSSTSRFEPPSKRPRFSSSQDPSSSSYPDVIKIYIVQAKIDPQVIADLLHIVESNTVYHKAPSLGVRDAGTERPSDDHHGGVLFQLCNDVDKAEVVITVVHTKKRLERHVDWKLAVRSLSLPVTLDSINRCLCELKSRKKRR